MDFSANGKKYIYYANIKDDQVIRNSFITLSKSVFGIDFEPWYNDGYWTNQYIPHVLCDGRQVVSNVSVNLIDIKWRGETLRCVQLGTIMTDPDHRCRGLSRWLIEKVLGQWCNNCDLIYLYANDTVIDFYPKFGFIRSTEYEYHKTITHTELSYRKLCMSKDEDRDLLLHIYQSSNPYSCFVMDGNIGLFMFYCSQFMRENIYYLPQTNTVIIAEMANDKLICYDVFSEKHQSLEEAIGSLIPKHSAEVWLGFSPKQATGWIAEARKEEDSTFFVLGKKKSVFEKNKLMFPLLSHA